MGRQHKRIEEMERNQSSPGHHTFNNFSISRQEEKPRESDKNCQKNDGEGKEWKQDKGEVTKEEEEGGKEKNSLLDPLRTISNDIDHFLGVIHSLKDSQNQTPEFPDSVINKLISMVENEIAKYESGDDKWSLSLLDAIDRVSKLSAAISTFSSESKYGKTVKHTTAVLQRAMSFLEEEFRLPLEDSRTNSDPSSRRSKTKQPPPHLGPNQEPDRRIIPAAESNPAKAPPPYSPEIVDKLRRIASVMISAGYESECCQAFIIARRNAFDAGLSDLGFEKMSIDDVQKMAWESLEGEIATWIKAFRQSISVFFSRERDLCESVFSNHRAIAGSLFSNLARGVVIQLLNFAEAVAMTKSSAEKLFKVLDMYETLRDMAPEMDGLFPGEEEASDLKSEISSARSRLGEAAVAIFCDLERSIKADVAKTPVPGGAVHPLTRYVMNYLEYACEYNSSLEQVFVENQKYIKAPLPDGKTNNVSNSHTPFATELVEVMDLLDSNLESKSKLYKDSALSNIFLMNNGRYIVKKIKESAEIYELLGESWYRKRSADLRQYHKNYQRETWAKVLSCLKDEGLQVKGSVSKPALKERLKSFNAIVEDIHKTQSSWVVSDGQLQSELRVSVSAVVVPAYRSFLGRYRQYLITGKQTEKYIKFGPEDLEAYIDELFDGNPLNQGRKRT